MISTGTLEYDLIKNRRIDKYHGKTARLKSYQRDYGYSSNDIELEHPKVISNDGILTLTNIEVLFGVVDNNKKSLGRGSLWDTIMDELENSSTQTTTKWTKFNRGTITSYEIPVLSHTVLRSSGDTKTSPGSRFGQKWLTWKGVSYDPAKLYVVNNNGPGTPDRLKAVCAVTETPMVFKDNSFIKPIPFKACKANNVRANGNSAYAIPLQQSSVYNSCFAYSNEETPQTPIANTPENCLDHGIIIDLKVVHLVTHIAVRGEAPSALTFPHQFYRRSSNKAKKMPGAVFGNKFLRRQGSQGRRRRRRGGSVQVLRHQPSELPHVTSFDIYEKDLASGKWVLAAQNVSVAPTNYGITSTIVDLKTVGAFNCSAGLRSRFVKLIPTSWHISPVFRVMVYGTQLAGLLSQTPHEIVEDTFPHRKATKRQLRQEARDVAAQSRSAEHTALPVETRTYTVSRPMKHNSNWKLDGAACCSWKDYYYCDKRDADRKKLVKAAMRDTADM